MRKENTKAMSGGRPVRLLVIGPGSRSRGGISSVIQLHRGAPFWKRMQAQLLSTYDDRGALEKLSAAAGAYAAAPFRIMRARVVHVHVAAQLSLLRKLPFVCIARALRKPLVVHVHAASEESLFRKTPRFAVRFTLRSASRVIALSESWAEAIVKHVPQARVVVVPNPVSTHDPANMRPRSRPVVLYVGKLEPRKGYADLLTAAAAVLRDFPAAQFWFAGHGETAQARARCEQLGIGGSVRLLGWVGRTHLEQLYREASVLALPSYGEGVPMAVLEAMSHGVPVICTPVGGLPELIEDGRNGLFVAPGDPAALAAQIARLLGDPARAASLAIAASETVQQRCGLAAVSRSLETLYAELLSPAASR